MREVKLRNAVIDSEESHAVATVLELDPESLNGQDLEEFAGIVAITSSFTGVDPETGLRKIISPSRILAIPAITARYCSQVEAARGLLTVEQVIEAWQSNTPSYRDDRHPDHLFDIAQYNFGTDDPIDDIVRGITQAETRRQELIESYRSAIRGEISRITYERDLDDDTPEERIDAIKDTL